MVDIHITSAEIKKYILFIVLFNAVFPKLLEQSSLTIWVEDIENDDNVLCLSYYDFINKYDHFGLNEVAI